MLTFALLLSLSAPADEPAVTERAAALALPAPSPSLATLDAWGEALRPRGDELAFERIDWVTRFDVALREADSQQRPVFFWAMNGHPLGCT